MDNQFEDLPKEMRDALTTLTNVSEKLQIPLFCLIPTPSNPYYICNYDESFSKLTETNLIFIREMLAIQYHYTASLQYPPEILKQLKVLKAFDENFKTNAKKYLTEAGLPKSIIDTLIHDATIAEKIDYSFAKRLGDRDAG
jgi:hypothetical protein